MESSIKGQSNCILEAETVGDPVQRVLPNSTVSHKSEDAGPKSSQCRDDNDEISSNPQGLECDTPMTDNVCKNVLLEAVTSSATTLQFDLYNSKLLPLASEAISESQDVTELAVKTVTDSERMLLADDFHQERDEKFIGGAKDEVGNADIAAEIGIINNIEKYDGSLQASVTISSRGSNGDLLHTPQILELLSGQVGKQNRIEEDASQTHKSNLDVEAPLTDILPDETQPDLTVTQEGPIAKGDTKSYATLFESQSDIINATNVQDLQRIPQFIFSFKSPLSEFRGILLGMLRDVVDLHSILLNNGTGKFRI